MVHLVGGDLVLRPALVVEARAGAGCLVAMAEEVRAVRPSLPALRRPGRIIGVHHRRVGDGAIRHKSADVLEAFDLFVVAFVVELGAQEAAAAARVRVRQLDRTSTPGSHVAETPQRVSWAHGRHVMVRTE